MSCWRLLESKALLSAYQSATGCQRFLDCRPFRPIVRPQCAIVPRSDYRRALVRTIDPNLWSKHEKCFHALSKNYTCFFFTFWLAYAHKGAVCNENASTLSASLNLLHACRTSIDAKNSQHDNAPGGDEISKRYNSFVQVCKNGKQRDAT